MATLESTLPAGARAFVARHAGAVASFAAKLVVAGLIAYGTAQYRAGAAEATTSARIGAVEEKVETLNTNIVPRREHEAHWQAIESSQARTERDVREMRETEKQILLQLKK
jgi:hypothetical protein